MASSRCASLENSIEMFIEKTRKQEHSEQKETRRFFFDRVPSNKGETRSETAEIPPAKLNELLSEFILIVRTKEGRFI